VLAAVQLPEERLEELDRLLLGRFAPAAAARGRDGRARGEDCEGAHRRIVTAGRT
jgi:hypothetical protein